MPSLEVVLPAGSNPKTAPVGGTIIGTDSNGNTIGGLSLGPLAAGTNNIGSVTVATPTTASLLGGQLLMSGAAQQLYSTSYTIAQFGLVSAPTTNTGNIVVGLSTVSATLTTTQAGNRAVLGPGQSWPIPAGTNLNTIYVIDTVTTDVCEWSAI